MRKIIVAFAVLGAENILLAQEYISFSTFIAEDGSGLEKLENIQV